MGADVSTTPYLNEKWYEVIEQTCQDCGDSFPIATIKLCGFCDEPICAGCRPEHERECWPTHTGTVAP